MPDRRSRRDLPRVEQARPLLKLSGTLQIAPDPDHLRFDHIERVRPSKDRSSMCSLPSEEAATRRRSRGPAHRSLRTSPSPSRLTTYSPPGSIRSRLEGARSSSARSLSRNSPPMSASGASRTTKGRSSEAMNGRGKGCDSRLVDSRGRGSPGPSHASRTGTSAKRSGPLHRVQRPAGESSGRRRSSTVN